MKIDWKSKEARTAIWVFVTIASLIIFYRVIDDIDDLLGALRTGLGQAGTVLMPFVMGAAVCYILLPLVRLIDKRVFRFIHRDRLRRGASVLATYAVLGACLAWLLSYLVPILVSNVQDFAANLDTYLEKGENIAVTLLDENAILSQPAVRKAIESGIDRIGVLLEDGTQQIVQAVPGTVKKITGIVTDTFIAFMTSIYLLTDIERIKESFKRMTRSLFKGERADRLFLFTHDADRIFGQYVRARLFESLMVFVATLIGFTANNVPYAVLFALVGAITNIVPFFGPIVGFLITVLLVLLISPAKALYAGLFILILQQLDGYVIGPKVMGEGVNLRPLWVLMAVSAGSVFGLAGMVLGVPVAAFIGTQLSRFTAARVGPKPMEPKKKRWFGKKQS
ncbi:MAG: AI-2E family transporter [Candidatus Spyradocola sp.]